MEGQTDRTDVFGIGDRRAGKAGAKQRRDGITQDLRLSRENFRILFLSVSLLTVPQSPVS